MHITLESILGKKSGLPDDDVKVDRELVINLRNRITGEHFIFDVSFPEKLELNYQDAGFRQSLVLIRFILIAGLLFFISLHLLESMANQTGKVGALLNRIPAIITLAVLLFFSYLPNFKHNYQNAITLCVILTCISVLAGVVHYTTEPYVTLNYIIVYMIFLFGVLAMPITTKHAMLAGVVVFSLIVSTMTYIKHTPADLRLLLVFLLFCGFAAAVGFSYIMDRLSRVNYLQGKLLIVEKANLNKNNIHLEGLAKTDALTGIGNRRCFDIGLEEEWNRAMRKGGAISLLLLDIDYFKQYNDIYGHQAGDECLIHIAEMLAGKIRRSSDTLARYGGEEFALVLPELGPNELQRYAERVCKTMEKQQLAHKGSKVASVVTCSVGAASWTLRPQDKLDDFILATDQALYKAKQTGRNRVVTF
ncbi:MAG: GGDEF domain-containing protein [Gammaproteobacteria bacterium]|nr:GGDEF domain-containing protein [Gammaproteobacteria bacterium]